MEFFDQLQMALTSLDISRLEPLLAHDVRMGSCVGRPQVAEYLRNLMSGDVTAELAEFAVHPDRAVARFELQSPNPEQLPFERQSHFAVLFWRDHQIVELQFVENPEQALTAVLSPLPPPPPQTRTTFQALAPVLPVRELASALEHYRRLGFSVSSYPGSGYGYAERDCLHLHLVVVAELNPTKTTSAVYVYVQDANSLYAEWRSAGVSGQFFEPHETEYGLLEGAHVDRDGNLIRFGSAIRDRGSLKE